MTRTRTTGFWWDVARRAAFLSALAGGIYATPAAADEDKFHCQSEGSQGGQDWPRYGHDLKNNRCSETKIEASSLDRDWQISGLTGVTSVPVADQNRVYFGDWNGVLHKVKAQTGEPIWQVDLGPFIRSTPAVDHSRVYAATNNTVFAVDAFLMAVSI